MYQHRKPDQDMVEGRKRERKNKKKKEQRPSDLKLEDGLQFLSADNQSV